MIRPDLVLTDEGYTIAEIDSVPGGIGLTAWLNQTYSAFDKEIIGGAEGMLEGFQTVLPKGGDIVIAEESATYRPEMEWIVARLKDRRAVAGVADPGSKARSTPAGVSDPGYSWRVVSAENYEPQDGRDVYRFFELFDLPNIPNIDKTLRAVAEEKIKITPPIKPYLEEKMWFALFWMQPLREFWRRELGEKYFLKLQEVIPYSWLLDPTPLPQHAVIPRLEIQDWREAGKFSQKDRDLLLKVSGFSPLGWGSRGISLGSDLPHTEWQQRIDDALATFDSSPMIMQKFHKGRLFEHRYWDADSGELKTMKGRVRLCPYFFVEQDKVKLRGGLGHDCSRRQKTSARNERRDPRADESCGFKTISWNLLGNVENPAALFAVDDFFTGFGVHDSRRRHFHVATGANIVLERDDRRIAFALKQALESIEQIFVDLPGQIRAFVR